MSKIKILHIIKSLGRGGAEMLLPETLKIHNTEKFEFHYIYFLPWKNQMVSEIEKNGGIVQCFDAKNNIQLITKAGKVIDYCNVNNIQLIHCHLPWAGFLGRYVHSKIKTPLVYTEHNMQERYHPATKFLNKKTFNSQSLAIGVSDDVSKSINKNIQPKIPVKTILNGVNTDKFKRDTTDREIRNLYNLPEDSFVIGLVSVFRFQKRIKEWLQVFAMFSKDKPNVFALIVGAGPLEKEVSDEIDRLNIKKKVVMAGLQEKTIPYYNAMDVFMMSSSFEGLPIALLEAMSMECAIVTTDAGGIKEVIRNEDDGLVVGVDSWKELESKLEMIYENDNLRSNLQMLARKRVVSSFSLQTMVDNLEYEYSNLIK